MATTASGSGGHPPPTGGQDPKKGFGHQVSNSLIPPSGDGKTPKNAAWSSTLRTTSQTTKTYVVDGLGLVPRYRRTILEEARSFAQIYTILDGDTYQVVAQLPPGPMANPSMPTATGIDQQNVNTAAHENVIATSGGAAAEQYNAAQVHHGDAFNDSGAENANNSSDEHHAESSASSGMGSSGAASSN